MAWISAIAQRRIRIAHRCEIWARQAERRGKPDRAKRLRDMAARNAKVAYDIEEGYRAYVTASRELGAA